MCVRNELSFARVVLIRCKALYAWAHRDEGLRPITCEADPGTRHWAVANAGFYARG
jgi:hypothetical protein